MIDAFFVFSPECKTSSRFDMWYNLWNLSITESDFVFGIWFDFFASIEFSVCGGKLCCLADICRRFSTFTSDCSDFRSKVSRISFAAHVTTVYYYLSKSIRARREFRATEMRCLRKSTSSCTFRGLTKALVVCVPKSLWEMPSSSEKRRKRCKYLFQMIDIMEMKGSNGCKAPPMSETFWPTK